MRRFASFWRNMAFIPRQAYVERLEAERDALRAEVERLRARSADDLRDAGWSVAVHNDYRQNDERHTFWLLTKNGCAIKGEGINDATALDQVRAAVGAVEGSEEA